jgi:hypothetical protein
MAGIKDRDPELSHVYRLINRDGPLFRYLASRNALEQFNTTSFGIILPLIKVDILKEKLQDPTNASIIMCNQELENIFGMKALHVKQVRSVLFFKHLEVVDPGTPPPEQFQVEAVSPLR